MTVGMEKCQKTWKDYAALSVVLVPTLCAMVVDMRKEYVQYRAMGVMRANAEAPLTACRQQFAGATCLAAAQRFVNIGGGRRCPRTLSGESAVVYALQGKRMLTLHACEADDVAWLATRE